MNNLKKYRKLRKMSQIELAHSVGLKWHSFISNCETGEKRLPYDLAVKIANVLDCDVLDLMGDDVFKKGVEDGANRDALQRLKDTGSITVDFHNLVNKYLSISEFNQFSTTKEKQFYLCLQLIDEELDSLTTEDIIAFKNQINNLISELRQKYGARNVELEFADIFDEEDNKEKEEEKENEKK